MPTSVDLTPASDQRPLKVSVVVPAYNSRGTIERCMNSLAAQRTRQRFEVIVVDSGQDNTCVLAEAALSAVRTVKLHARVSAARARHIGTTYARGELLAFIDSDAYAGSNWIDNVVAAAETGYDLACGSIGNANPEAAVSRAEQLLMHNEFLPDAPQGPSWFALSGNMVIRKSAYSKYGPFPDVRAAEDIVFSRELIASGGTICFCPSLIVYHENRTHIYRYLKNQVVVGKHTAIARRIVKFADTESYGLFIALLPAAPIVKLAKLTIRMVQRDWHNLRRILASLPLLFIGVCAYSLGMVAGVFTPISYRRAAG